MFGFQVPYYEIENRYEAGVGRKDFRQFYMLVRPLQLRLAEMGCRMCDFFCKS